MSNKGYNTSNSLVWHTEYTNTVNAEDYLISYSFLDKLNNNTGTATYQYE